MTAEVYYLQVIGIASWNCLGRIGSAGGRTKWISGARASGAEIFLLRATGLHVGHGRFIGRVCACVVLTNER